MMKLMSAHKLLNASFGIQQKHIHLEWLLQTILGTDALLLCGFQLEWIRGVSRSCPESRH